MTDRHAGYVVTLDENVRDDDATDIVTALGQIKGVIAVTPVIGDASLSVIEARARHSFAAALYDAIEGVLKQ